MTIAVGNKGNEERETKRAILLHILTAAAVISDESNLKAILYRNAIQCQLRIDFVWSVYNIEDEAVKRLL